MGRCLATILSPRAFPAVLARARSGILACCVRRWRRRARRRLVRRAGHAAPPRPPPRRPTSARPTSSWSWPTTSATGDLGSYGHTHDQDPEPRPARRGGRALHELLRGGADLRAVAGGAHDRALAPPDRHRLEPPASPPRRRGRDRRGAARTAATPPAWLGKWHLGWDPTDMPIHHGFDYFYGIPTGEDESKFVLGDQPTKDTVSPDQLAQRYTDYAIKWITAATGPPFFLYLAHRDPHLPNAPRRPSSRASRPTGLYGDTVEELDATVGDLMKALKDLGIDQNTLVIFTSDNGPVIPPLAPAPRALSTAARARARRAASASPASPLARPHPRRAGRGGARDHPRPLPDPREPGPADAALRTAGTTARTSAGCSPARSIASPGAGSTAAAR